MIHILRLWRVHAYLDLMLLTRGPRQFLVWSLSDAVDTVASITAMLLLAERFGGIGQWSIAQVLFLLAFAALAMSLSMTFFGYNVMWISRRVGRGQLDHTLVQPQPLWRALLTEGFMPLSGSIMVVPSLGLLAWSAARLPLSIGPAWLALLALSLIGSMAAVLAFSFLCGSLAFWAPAGAEEISTRALDLVSDLKSFPLDGAGRALRAGLTAVVPVGLVAWLPCRHLTGLAPIGPRALLAPILAGALCAAAFAVFGKGLAHYARNGSRRYSSFGHRR